MKRLKFTLALATLALGILVAPLAADAQPPTVPRIGYLAIVPAPPDEAFRQRLRELGYVEGQNVLIEYRYAHGRYERLPDIAVDLVRLRPDVIVAVTTPATLAAKEITTTIPIVMVDVADPVGSGFVASLARPGGNITGVSALQSELVAKELQLLHEAVPKLSRVAVPVESSESGCDVR